jgi:twitching motility protein PilT
MNASAYDLPDGELPPPPGPSMFEKASYLNAPPPSVPPGGFADYASAPPPPAGPSAGHDFGQPFDPSAFPPPVVPGATRETFEPPVAPPSFDAAAAYDSAFDPSAYAAPTPAYDTAFDPAAFAPPSVDVPTFDSGFDPAAFGAPSAFEASAFDTSAFDTTVDDSIPVFDSGAFDAPAFDPAAFEAPPAFDPAAFEAPPAPPVVAPESTPVAPPAWDAPPAPAVPVAAAPSAPVIPTFDEPRPAAPAFEVPPAASAVAPSFDDLVAPAATTSPAIPTFAAPAVPVAAAPPAEATSRRAERERAAAQAAAAAAAAQPDVTVAAPVAQEPAAQEPAAQVPAAQPSAVVDAPAETFAPPVGAPIEAPAPPVAAEAPAMPVFVPAPPSALFPPPAMEAHDVDESFDFLANLGQGQEGSDPDLVAALNIVVSLGASDLHVSVGTVPMVRIDGGLQQVPGFDEWSPEKVTEALHSIMSPEHRDQFANELELDFAYTLSKDSRFRVNIYQQRDSLGAAFRLIPTEIKQLSALGIPERIGNFAQLPRGLVLVTGPTGSGKSTTLAALIDLVNSTRADHIVTVEDPIEFMHTNKKSLVNQREVGHDTHSFNNALKHVLRQDPDVILIGELRDLETISVALTAAETGHLVFATLHTQDAAQTIDRVIDVFPPHQQGQVRAQLAATLQGVICQTLVKKVGGGGRAVATEVLVTTPAISNLIREGKTYQIHSSMQAGRELGMHTMDQHLADLVNAGVISHQAAHEKAHDVEDLKQLIQRSGTNSDPGGMRMPSGGIDFGDAHSTRA